MERDRMSFDVLGKIEAEKKKRQWIKYQLAKNAGLPQSTISTWNKKYLQPSLVSIENICDGLGISLSDFFSEDAEVLRPTTEQKAFRSFYQHVLSTLKVLPKKIEPPIPLILLGFWRFLSARFVL